MSRWITIEAAELAVKALEEENARLKVEVGRLQSVHILDSIGIEQLKAEVERLHSDIQMEKENEDRLMREWQKANNEIYNLQTKVVALVDDQTRLKAKVERLTKAGDHLWAFAHNCVVLGVYPKTAQEKINIWNAAKDGKDAQ